MHDTNGRRSALRGTRPVLAFVGAGLLVFSVGGSLRGYLLAESDLRKFESARRQGAELRGRSQATSPPDTTEWSIRPVEAFEQAGEQSSGLPMAVLEIPSLDLSVPVHAGTDELTLNRGVGWIEGTARPGARGNLGLAGHRDGFFRSLRHVRVGDGIKIVTLDGVHLYEVERHWIVSPDEVEVLASSTGGRHVTLVTCYPFFFVGSAPQRFIVRGRYVGFYKNENESNSKDGSVASGDVAHRMEKGELQ